MDIEIVGWIVKAYVDGKLKNVSRVFHVEQAAQEFRDLLNKNDEEAKAVVVAVHKYV